ncbi:MAG: nucleoside-diphosphate kinase [Deltaproteobacteria bacterium]|nr:nucleoside-diphosphate kinase [Deltaproteobacteria bacterium]
MIKDDLEKTLVLIKPDALKNSLTGYILSQLSEFHTGLHFAATKIVSVSRMLAEEHYAEHRGKFFYPSLLDYITGCLHYPDEPWKRRVIALVYQGPNAIKKIRDIVGPTNPHEARSQRPGCIRSLGSVIPVEDTSGKVIGYRSDNLIHASASVIDAEREIKLWFMPTDIPPFMRDYPVEVCEEHYYLSDNKICTTHELDSVCLFAPGDLIWESDIEAIRLHLQGLQASCSINAVVAKYLINTNSDSY